jgi:hypothetical protein
LKWLAVDGRGKGVEARGREEGVWKRVLEPVMDGNPQSEF